MTWIYNSLTDAGIRLANLAPAADNPFSNYWRRNTDASLNPFRGLYATNGFDVAIMIPYFLVMTILAVHRSITAACEYPMGVATEGGFKNFTADVSC